VERGGGGELCRWECGGAVIASCYAWVRGLVSVVSRPLFSPLRVGAWHRRPPLVGLRGHLSLSPPFSSPHADGQLDPGRAYVDTSPSNMLHSLKPLVRRWGDPQVGTILMCDQCTVVRIQFSDCW